MHRKCSALLSAALLAASCGTASAYTLNGTVSNSTDGKAIEGAKIQLLTRGISTTTDFAGKFLIQETDAIKGAAETLSAGYFSLKNGILNFSQGGQTPTLVRVYDLVGNLMVNKSLQGSGSLDLTTAIDAQGTYIAHIKSGNAQESFRFNVDNKNYSGLLSSSKRSALRKIGDEAETLQVTADGFDTLKMLLANLDTTLDIKLTAAVTEQTYAFGYALKNAPRPSKGCGKTASLQQTGQNSNAKKYRMQSAGLDREFWLTLPNNYDNTKPHKILFSMACMGSSGEDFSNHAPDADHPSPYYGQQKLDTEGNYIFVSPEPNSNSFGPWRNDDKDHVFFGDMLTLLEDNYCIDTTRVFVTGFSFGAMFTNSLSWDYQDRIRAVAVYATAAYNIYLPQNKGKPIAWMAVHGKNDGTCEYGTDRGAKNLALKTILKNNGKADANGNFTDASGEKLEEIQDNIAGHLCYDFKTVDERFPVKFCSWNGTHQWTAHDGPQYRQQYANWEQTWVPDMVHEWFEQF